MPTSILITGCSSGIGLTAATQLKARGYRVFASARKTTDCEKLITAGFETVQLDVTDPASIKTALQQILQKTGGTLDAIFNNAGYMQTGAIEDLSTDIMQKQFATNVFGPMELVRQTLPIMRKQGHGRIIQNSSILGVITLPFYGAYNASKFALEGFSSTLRQELRGTNIFVSIINPGPITTDLRENAHQHFKQNIKDRELSQHHETYETLERTYFNPSKRDRKASGSTDLVVKQLIAALESKHPRAHYFVGMPAQVLAILRRILPDSALDWLLSKVR